MSVVFDKKLMTFYLDSKSCTYAFFINKKGYLEHLYFGKKIPHDPLFHAITPMTARAFPPLTPGEDITKNPDYIQVKYQHTPSELCFFGNGDYREPTVLTECENGDRTCELLYESHEILKEKPAICGMPSLDCGGDTLVVHLRDAVTNFCADLYYSTYEDSNVISRRIVFRNEGEKKIVLRRAYSFNFTLPNDSYDCLTLRGAWGIERRIQRNPLQFGNTVIDSKRCTSSATMNPFMAILDHNATEDRGNAYGVSLIYSSSFALRAEKNPDGTVNVSGGVNDFAFSWNLDTDESFETPEVILAYSDEGIGGMSRELHDVMRNHIINKRFVAAARPIVINHWEATTFHFTTEKLIAFADAVKGTDIDTFVMDDGWFGKRDNDLSGLGDWVVNEEKMPGGLKPLIDHVHSLGMKFGIWFEPEMINEDSDIFRSHPDYAIYAPDRERCYQRHQFMMDLTREDVRDYIVNSVNKIIEEHDIDYIKWDYNRNMSEYYSPSIPEDRQGEFAHRYALGVYDLFERIVEANPDIFFEGCSGGGGRFDPAVLHYFPQIWTSDNSCADERTLIQYGTSIAYPLSAMSCHVSDVPNYQSGRITSFETRANIAHLGATGYELDSTRFTDEDRAVVKKQVADYKEMQDLVINGDLYRIGSSFEDNVFGMMVVAKNKSQAHLTLYRHLARQNDVMPRIYVKGLDGNKKYFVREFNTILSGETLMNVGFVPDFGKGDFKTLIYHFEEK